MYCHLKPNFIKHAHKMLVLGGHPPCFGHVAKIIPVPQDRRPISMAGSMMFHGKPEKCLLKNMYLGKL